MWISKKAAFLLATLLITLSCFGSETDEDFLERFKRSSSASDVDLITQVHQFEEKTLDRQSQLFQDLKLVREIDRELNDTLPFLYNYSFVGGYLVMPSARMPQQGTVGFHEASVPPYSHFGVSFQPYTRIEVSAVYRIYNGILDSTMGTSGFGDYADRTANLKLALIMPWDDNGRFPTLAYGAEDFIGTKAFNAYYFVLTQVWTEANLEASFGWGKKRIKGPFGGVAWTPWRKVGNAFFKDITLIAEYDNLDYKKNPREHPKGKHVRWRINTGISYLWKDALQLTISSVRGEKLAGMASFRYPLGTTDGLYPKNFNPKPYSSPVDTEPVGPMRERKTVAQELAHALGSQGINAYSIYYTSNKRHQDVLWIKVVNNLYRNEKELRERLQNVLAALTPENVEKVIVVVEAVGVDAQEYRFYTRDLYRFRKREINAWELAILSPMRAPTPPPNAYEGERLFHRTKAIWTFTLRPRIETFMGSAKGKFKYAISAVATPEGYLFDRIYYRMQFAYVIHSTMWDIGDTDLLNPSYLPNVRTDEICYKQSRQISIEEAYLQRSWHLSKGWYYRLAAGWFEPMYAGGATELLWYPPPSNWALGFSFATVLKRHYHGLGVTNKIRQLQSNNVPYYKHFIGFQAFFDIYYDIRIWKILAQANIGQFLAKDRGVRLQAMRYFNNGTRFGIWYTVTNGKDYLNRSRYHDKGFIFVFPLDFFLRKSSRTLLDFSMNAWVRDVGQISATGKRLYPIIYEERND